MTVHVAPLLIAPRPPPPRLDRVSVETVGTEYVISAGAPEPCAPGVDPAELLCEVALRCRDAVRRFNALGQPVRARMGLNAGPIVGEREWGGTCTNKCSPSGLVPALPVILSSLFDLGLFKYIYFFGLL